MHKELASPQPVKALVGFSHMVKINIMICIFPITTYATTANVCKIINEIRKLTSNVKNCAPLLCIMTSLLTHANQELR